MVTNRNQKTLNFSETFKKLYGIDDIEDSREDDQDSKEDIDYESHPEARVLPKSDIDLKHGNNIVSALTCNHSGSRLVSGGYNHQISMWDFHTMDSTLHSFRTFSPLEQNLIKNVAFNPTDEYLLVSGTDSIISILNKDGVSVCQTIKGDQYIVDKMKTKGHVSSIQSSCWNPQDLEEFLSVSIDGTLRTWKVINCEKSCKNIYKLKNRQGRNSHGTYCTYSSDGWGAYVSTLCGSLQYFDLRKTMITPTFKIENFHMQNTGSSCLTLNREGTHLISRGLDDSLKIYDLRSPRKELLSVNNLPNNCEDTKCILSPDYRMIITGTSITKSIKNGRLCFIKYSDGEILKEIEYENASVVTELWHPKLCQIFVGLSNGNINVCYDDKKSVNGVLQCIGYTKNRRIYEGEDLIQPKVILPNDKPERNPEEVDEVLEAKIKLHEESIRTKRPDLPIVGHGCGGRLTSELSVSAYLVKQLGLGRKDDAMDNPREAILKYAKLAEEDPYFVAPAYKETQPKPIFKEEVEDESEENRKRKSGEETKDK